METHNGVIHVLLVLGVSVIGSTAVVKTQQTVVVAVGEEARLSCQLKETKNVVQITWQKILPEGEKNLATYSKHFGFRVTPGSRKGVELTDTGCTLVISEVTEQDEGCYRCLFNTYPNGAFIGTTCLMLSELHEPILRVGDWNSSSESVVSCSATGRPAPTVRLSVTQPQLRLSHYDTVSVNNNNGSVTVTTSAVLSGVHNSGAQVGCAVRALSEQREAFVRIHEVKPTPAGDENLVRGSNEEPGSEDRFFGYLILLLPFTIFSIAIVYFCVFFSKNSLPHRDLEMSEMQQIAARDTDMSQTPSPKSDQETDASQEQVECDS